MRLPSMVGQYNDENMYDPIVSLYYFDFSHQWFNKYDLPGLPKSCMKRIAKEIVRVYPRMILGMRAIGRTGTERVDGKMVNVGTLLANGLPVKSEKI